MGVVPSLFVCVRGGLVPSGWSHKHVTSAGVLYSAKYNKRKLRRAEWSSTQCSVAVGQEVQFWIEHCPLMPQDKLDNKVQN